MVVQTDDVARIRLFNVRTVARHKGQRIGDHHVFPGTHLAQLHALFILTGHHAHKGHAVAVFRVHIGLNFEHEAGEFLFLRFHFTGVGFTRHRTRRPLHQTVQHVVNAEVTQRGTEEDRGDFTAQEQLFIELVRRPLHQLQLVAQLRGQLFADCRVQLRVIQTFHHANFLNGVAFTGLIQVGFVFIEVIHPFEQLTAANWPGDWRTGDFQLAFHFVHHFHRVTDVAVEFVHEGEDRRIAQTGDFHQLTGPVFYTFRGVDHHQTAVHRRQGTVGIFGEVFVARGVQQVHQAVVIRELHHGGGNRNTTLLFHLHPVRFCMLAGATAFNGTRSLDRLSEQQHLLSDGRFTGIRVRDNGKSAALGHLLQIRRQRHN